MTIDNSNEHLDEQEHINCNSPRPIVGWAAQLVDTPTLVLIDHPSSETQHVFHSILNRNGVVFDFQGFVTRLLVDDFHRLLGIVPPLH